MEVEMKVRVAFTLDVDPEGWANEFGIERAEVSQDVKVYFETIATSQLRDVLHLAAPTREP